MTTIPVAICGLLYLATSVGFAMKHQWGWSLSYFAYAVANVGLIMASLSEQTK